MQGPSWMGASGRLEKWDRSGDFGRITAPTLVIGNHHDTKDPRHVAWKPTQFPRCRFLLCPSGGHLAMSDEQQTCFTGLSAFLENLDAGRV